jgi:hypothetical protein
MKAWHKRWLGAAFIVSLTPNPAWAGGETGSLERDPNHPPQGDGATVRPVLGGGDNGWAIIVSRDQYKRLVFRLSYMDEAAIPGMDGLTAKKVGSVIVTKDQKKQVIPLLYEKQ